jgi:hypothetical protein
MPMNGRPPDARCGDHSFRQEKAAGFDFGAADLSP